MSTMGRNGFVLSSTHYLIPYEDIAPDVPRYYVFDGQDGTPTAGRDYVGPSRMVDSSLNNYWRRTT